MEESQGSSRPCSQEILCETTATRQVTVKPLNAYYRDLYLYFFVASLARLEPCSGGIGSLSWDRAIRAPKLCNLRSEQPNTLFLGKTPRQMHILSPVIDNCPSWTSGRERMALEIISWPMSRKNVAEHEDRTHDGPHTWRTRATTFGYQRHWSDCVNAHADLSFCCSPTCKGWADFVITWLISEMPLVSNNLA